MIIRAVIMTDGNVNRADMIWNAYTTVKCGNRYWNMKKWQKHTLIWHEKVSQ